MTIHYDGNATEMIGWPGYDFPKPPQMEILHCMSISQQTLSDLVRQTSFAARKEDLRPIFTGLLFEVSGNDVTVVGTDSFRLAMMEEKVNNETGDDFHVVIPVRALQELIGQGSTPFGVYVTSPDYLGGMEDIRALSAVCDTFGVPLLVDNAHGAYLRFLPGEPLHPIALGRPCAATRPTRPCRWSPAVRICIWRTMPLCRTKRLCGRAGTVRLYQPSYLILQSLDACNAVLAGDYPRRLVQCCVALEGLRRSLNKAAAARQCPVPLAVAGHSRSR